MDKIYVARLREYAQEGLGLTANQYWKIQKTLVDDGSLVLTKDKAKNANYAAAGHARALLEALQAHESAKPTAVPLNPEIAAAIAAARPPAAVKPPKKSAEPTAEELAKREGPQGGTPANSDKKTDKKTDPDPDDEKDPPAKGKKFKMPSGAWKWLVVAGAGIIGFAVVRSWLSKRKVATQLPPAAEAVQSDELDISPEALRANLEASGFQP